MFYDRTTVLPHPADVVVAWHERPGALVRLTPPGLGSASGEGDEVTVRLGPALLPSAIRPRWRLAHTRHEYAATSDEFIDVQVSGPMRRWSHRHEIHGAGEGRTEIRDRIDLELPRGAGLGEGILRRRLDRLFDFRARQLRDDLAFHAATAERPRLTVAIAGSSGLIGTQLVALLESGGHRVLRMVRRPVAGPGEIAWDPDAGRLDAADLAGVDAVVNLAGRPIATRFTPRARDEILSSRTRSADLVARTIAAMPAGERPGTLVQASAIGFYGAERPGELLTESDPGGEDFLAEVTRSWQQAAEPAEAAGVRVAHLRTGIVLSDGGGALLPQLPLFLLGVGGRLAPPEAVVSWITLDDMVRAYAHVLLTPSAAGPLNAVAPHPAQQSEFVRTLGRVLHRPAAVPVPAAGPTLLLGREATRELIRADQRVDDARLRSSGFRPAHPELEGALRHVLQR